MLSLSPPIYAFMATRPPRLWKSWVAKCVAPDPQGLARHAFTLAARSIATDVWRSVEEGVLHDDLKRCAKWCGALDCGLRHRVRHRPPLLQRSCCWCLEHPLWKCGMERLFSLRNNLRHHTVHVHMTAVVVHGTLVVVIDMPWTDDDDDGLIRSRRHWRSWGWHCLSFHRTGGGALRSGRTGLRHGFFWLDIDRVF